MPWTYHIIETAATGAGTSDSFNISHPYPGVLLQIYPKANLSGTTADLQVQEPDGSGWGDCYDDNGKITLSDSRPQEVVYGPGTFRLNFTARTSSVGAGITKLFDSGA